MDKSKTKIEKANKKSEREIAVEIANTLRSDAKISMISMIVSFAIFCALLTFFIISKIAIVWIVVASIVCAIFCIAMIVAIVTNSKCKKIQKGINEATIYHGKPDLCVLNGSLCTVNAVIGDDKKPITFNIDAKILEPIGWDRSFVCVKSSKYLFVYTQLPNNENTMLYTHEAEYTK